jgi:hypothetical protein
MLDFIWDIYQHGQIAEAKSEAEHATQQTATQAERIERLEASLSRMALVSQAMWEVLRAKLVVPEAELLAKIQEIDLRDGVEDGKMGSETTTCPKCERKQSARNARCLYCGTAIPRAHVFA